MINKTYLQATKNWKSLIDLKETQKITHLLNNGTFAITRKEYESFDKSSERIHYYFGIINTGLYVFIIDSENDGAKNHSKVLVKKLTYGVDISTLANVKNDSTSEVSVENFLRSVFNWNLLSYNWIEDKLNNDSLFEGISNPKIDLETEFKDPKIQKVYHFLGLHHEDKEKRINAEVDSNISKYKLDLFCTYVCKKDNGNEQYWEWSWPYYSDQTKKENKDMIYSLFDGS